MKKVSLFLVLFIICCNYKVSEKKEHIYMPSVTKSEIRVPNIKFDNLNHNLGTLKKGETISKYIKFRNKGGTDLIISNVKSSCGCTVANWPKNPIPKNQKDSILLQINTSSLTGKVRKSITIITNSIPNTKVITINAKVE